MVLFSDLRPAVRKQATPALSVLLLGLLTPLSLGGPVI
jgi:hypothetical protein